MIRFIKSRNSDNPTCKAKDPKGCLEAELSLRSENNNKKPQNITRPYCRNTNQVNFFRYSLLSSNIYISGSVCVLAIRTDSLPNYYGICWSHGCHATTQTKEWSLFTVFCKWLSFLTHDKYSKRPYLSRSSSASDKGGAGSSEGGAELREHRTAQGWRHPKGQRRGEYRANAMNTCNRRMKWNKKWGMESKWEIKKTSIQHRVQQKCVKTNMKKIKDKKQRLVKAVCTNTIKHHYTMRAICCVVTLYNKYAPNAVSIYFDNFYCLGSIFNHIM